MTKNNSLKENVSIFVMKMNSLSLNTVESILEIGNLMIEAKQELKKDEYQEFLKLTKYDKNSSSIRKWEVIGKSYLRLKPIASMLPPIWSTIYKLASLKPSQLDHLHQINLLHSSVTAKEIDAELKIPLSKKPHLRLTIDLDDGIDAETAKQLIAEISRYSCTFKKSAELEVLLNSTAISNASLKLAA